MRRLAILSCILFIYAPSLWAQKTVFDNVVIRRHRSAEKRVLVDKVGTLTFDDTSHQLTFNDHADDHIEVGYNDVKKVLSEVTTHMRAGGVSRGLSFVEIPFGLIAASALAGVHVNSDWIYVSYQVGGDEVTALFETSESSYAQIVAKFQGVFGARMSVSSFPQKAAEIKLGDVKEAESRQTVKVDQKNHPLPETKSNKATVVVVCPPLPAHREGSGAQFKLHANDEVIAVNRLGTYSFAYLDPGTYRLVSQQQNASGFTMELEAGHEYFFLQNTFQDGLSAAETVLTRNSPELVTYFLDGSYFSDWKPK